MNFIVATLFLWVVFLTHRLFAFKFHWELSPGLETESWRIFFVGALSDFWMSALISALFSLVSELIRFLTKRDYSKQVLLSVLLAFTVFSAGHQAYVEFFKYQILPFHLTYLFDKEFIQANGASSIHFSFLAIMFVGVFLSGAFLLLPRKKTNFVWPLIFFCSALGLHAIHIRLKVQWFVPQNLQSNYVERLYDHVIHTPSPQKLSIDEKEALTRYTKSQNNPFTNPEISKQTKYLKNEIEKTQKPKIFLTIVLESFRYFDAGAYHRRENKKSITPHFDALASNGVLFSKAFSSGTVTRSGQEAVWCGYIGGINSSLMRTFQKADVPCLLHPFQKKFPHGSTMWLHGGDGKFDDQRSFWKRKGAIVTMDKTDFPDDAARTGWGVGDRTFFQKAFEKIAENDAKGNSTFAMLLSVSNHIPWDLPIDAPKDLEPKNPEHPAFKTIAYTDFALGEFISKMKASNLWSRSVILITGDHGNLEKTYHDENYSDPIIRSAELSTRVGMLLTGGFVEKAVAEKILPPIVDQAMSQSDIATFWNLLLNLETPTMGYDFFSRSNQNVLMSNLGMELYFPTTKSVENVSDKNFNQEKNPNSLYARDLTDFLYRQNKK